jgi:DNA mismatch repair ATPase MutS
MLVHIGRSKRDAALLKDSPAFAKISESGTTCAFFHQPWSVLGAAIVDVSNAILGAERDAFESLRAEVATHAAPLRRNARVVDELDVTVGFADIAAEMGWARPELSEECVLLCYLEPQLPS